MDQHKTQSAPELWQVTQNWLSLLGSKPNTKFCREEITTHPDYPALTSITDFLEAGGMEYDAVQADGTYIHEFNYPLLAHIKQPGNEYFYLVADDTIWDKQKAIIADWSGIVLFAKKGTAWHNKENDLAKKTVTKNRYLATALIAVGFLLFAGSVFFYTAVEIYLFIFLSLTGLIISIAALATELGYQGTLIKQVCGTISKAGCEKALSSKFAKGFFGITPADASVLYFASQFALCLLGYFYGAVLNGTINIAFAGIAVAGWSIYTQAVKLKDWCALCLCIVAVLTGQIIIASLYFNSSSITDYTSYLFFAVTACILTLLYLPVKKLIKTNNKNEQELNLLKKWKTDASLFDLQWQKEHTCDNTIWDQDLIIGDADAPIRITVACNPYCGPCAKTHKELDTLLEIFPKKICIQVRLLCVPANETNLTTIATKAILQQVAVSNNNNQIQTMLNNWFEWMDIDKWSKKWQCNPATDVSKALINHENWIKQTRISSTPTIFINGKRMPGMYTLKDIEKMVPQLSYATVPV